MAKAKSRQRENVTLPGLVLATLTRQLQVAYLWQDSERQRRRRHWQPQPPQQQEQQEQQEKQEKQEKQEQQEQQ